MIEKVLIDYLESHIDVPVTMEVPANMLEKFIVLEKTGGGMENHIFEATFAIQSYAGTLYEAANLNEQIKGYMLYGPTPGEIISVRLNSDYNYTDPSTKKYRYQAVYDIKHY